MVNAAILAPGPVLTPWPNCEQFATIRQFQALATIGYGPAKDSERTDAYWLVRSLSPSPPLPSLRIKLRNKAISDIDLILRQIRVDAAVLHAKRFL